MNNFTIKLSITKRRWYWPFNRVPICIKVNKKFTATFAQKGSHFPMVVRGFASDDGKLTTIVSQGDDSDGIEKLRFKQVTNPRPNRKRASA